MAEQQRKTPDRPAAQLIEYETVDARHQVQLIEEYTVDKVGVVEPSVNGHRRR